jgi:hypothetical protein
MLNKGKLSHFGSSILFIDGAYWSHKNFPVCVLSAIKINKKKKIGSCCKLGFKVLFFNGNWLVTNFRLQSRKYSQDSRYFTEVAANYEEPEMYSLHS